MKTLLEVKDLKVHYAVKSKLSITGAKRSVKAVDGISFEVFEGETLGLVGESGCGKTTTGKAIVRLLTPTAGSILYDGKDIFSCTKEEHKELSRKIQIIFQDPYSSLDPRFTLGRCIGEPLVIHKWKSPAERREHIMQLMRDVGLNEEHYTRFPHEFSGGQRQRIGVARSLALNPSLVVCDEPVSALDVSIQAQILNLMQELQQKYSLTYIFISHNLSVIKHISDRIAVMYLGHIVEIANKKDLFANPSHPYTQSLLDAIPVPNPEITTMSEPLEGDVPSPIDPPSGCVFHTRCKHAKPQCSEIVPQSKEIEPGHFMACLLND